MLCNTIHYKLPLLTLLWQDYVCLIAPYPYNPRPADHINFATDMDLSCEGLLWYARPQLSLFFYCNLAPKGCLRDTASHLQHALVFVSTFKPIILPIDAQAFMKCKEVPMSYSSASSINLPSLNLSQCRAEIVLGCVPKMQCFVVGSSMPVAHPAHRFGNSKGAVADTSARKGIRSRVY
jgi:hypothetical protein